MADFFKLSLVLQAAEMLEQPKGQMLFPSAPALRMRRPAPPASDDGAVPDVGTGANRPARQRSPFAYDEDAGGSDDESSAMDADELASKRMRLASSRMLNARNADTHNSVEKRRRAYLASCYEGLKDSVPMLTGSRASNVKVLRGAASYIKSLQIEEQRLVAEKKRLREQQEELLRQREKRLHDSEAAAMVPTVVFSAPAPAFTPVPRPAVARTAQAVRPSTVHLTPAPVLAPMLVRTPTAALAPAATTPAPVWSAGAVRAARRTSSDNDVAVTLMQLSGIAA